MTTPPRACVVGAWEHPTRYAPDKSVALKSAIRYTPTFVLVEDGQEKARIEGYPGEFFFWPRLENLLP